MSEQQVMTQESELMLSYEQKAAIKKGQLEEKNHRKEIPEDFYNLWKEAEQDEEKFSKVFGEHVKRLYAVLRKDDIISPELARVLVVGRYAKYRSVRRIESYLPPEAMNQYMADKARIGAAKRRAKKEKEAREKEIERQEAKQIAETEPKTQAEIKKHVPESESVSTSDIQIRIELPRKGYVGRTIAKLWERDEIPVLTYDIQGNLMNFEAIKEGQAAASPAM